MGNSILIGFVRWVWIALLTLVAAVLIHIALPLGWSYASRLSLPSSINITVLRIATWFVTILAGYAECVANPNTSQAFAARLALPTIVVRPGSWCRVGVDWAYYHFEISVWRFA